MSKHIYILKDMAKKRFAEQHPTIPEHCYPDFHYSDTTANGLTACIMSFLSLSNHFAARVNVGGTYSTKLNRYIKSGSTRGLSDVSAIVNGKSWSVEIKIGRDKQSPEQKKVEEQVKASGGIYTISRNFDQFYEFYTSHT